MSTEGMPQALRREVWLFRDDSGECRCVIDYDDHGCTEITREALTALLTIAGGVLEVPDA